MPSQCIACSEEIQEHAKLCKHCGTLQDDERFTSASQTSVTQGKKGETATTPKKGHICPRCESGDSVSSVATIIDNGTSTSASFTMMNQFGHPLNMYSGMSVGSTSSNLAARLSIGYQVAEFRIFRSLGFGLLLTFCLLQTMLFKPGGAADSGDIWVNLIEEFFITIVVGPLVGIIYGFVDKAEQRKKLMPSQMKALAAIKTMRNSYYCSRDDLVFLKNNSGSPEQYIQRLLS